MNHDQNFKNLILDYPRQDYPEATAIMNTFAERFIEQGKQQGMQQGEARLLIRQLTRKFGPLPDAVRERIESAGADTLLDLG